MITSRDIWHVYPRSLQMLPGIVHEAPGSGAFVSAAKCPTPRPKNSFENIFKNSPNTELHDQHFNRKQNHDKRKPENHQKHKLTTPLTPIPAKKRGPTERKNTRRERKILGCFPGVSRAGAIQAARPCQVWTASSAPNYFLCPFAFLAHGGASESLITVKDGQ